MSIGYRLENSGDIMGGRRFLGNLDEVSIYNRALSSNEIAAIYNAGSWGKCPPASTPPVITTQPTNQTVAVGGTAMFNVTAAGKRELKRDKLAAKYAKKYAELKAIATDAKRPMKSVQLHAWVCKSCHATQTQPVSVTAAPSRVVPVARSITSVWPVQRSVKWPLLVRSPASSRPAGKR